MNNSELRPRDLCGRPLRQDGGLTVRFEVPDNVSDDEALDHFKRYFAALDDLHRSLGGSGLRVIPPVEVHLGSGHTPRT